MHRIQLVRAPAGARTLRASAGGCAAQGGRRGAAPHPGRNLRRRSIVAFSLRSTARFAPRLRLAVSAAGRAPLQRPAPPTLGFAFLIPIHASGLARPLACGHANVARFFGRLRRTKRTAGRCPAPRQEPSPALNRRILPSVDCSFRTAPSARCFGRWPRSPSASCTSHFGFCISHPHSCIGFSSSARLRAREHCAFLRAAAPHKENGGALPRTPAGT